MRSGAITRSPRGLTRSDARVGVIRLSTISRLFLNSHAAGVANGRIRALHRLVAPLTCAGRGRRRRGFVPLARRKPSPSRSHAGLPRTPKPLRNDDYLGDQVVLWSRKKRGFQFAFKRKIFELARSDKRFKSTGGD